MRISLRVFAAYSAQGIEAAVRAAPQGVQSLTRLGLTKPNAAQLVSALAAPSAPGAFRLPRTASRVTVALQQPWERASGQYNFVKQALPRLAFNNPQLKWHVAYLPPTHDHVLRYPDGKEELVTHEQAAELRKKAEEEEQTDAGATAPNEADQAAMEEEIGMRKQVKPKAHYAKKPSSADTELLAQAELTSPAVRIDFQDGTHPQIIHLNHKSRT